MLLAVFEEVQGVGSDDGVGCACLTFCGAGQKVRDQGSAVEDCSCSLSIGRDREIAHDEQGMVLVDDCVFCMCFRNCEDLEGRD